mmetsp:Transcript_24457/g.77291  ORF Transcript_24457/g.77291 Transcript_24457/m.77291 type:complete len:235 (-) Transcript_24457:107-811(-)
MPRPPGHGGRQERGGGGRWDGAPHRVSPQPPLCLRPHRGGEAHHGVLRAAGRPHGPLRPQVSAPHPVARRAHRAQRDRLQGSVLGAHVGVQRDPGHGGVPPKQGADQEALQLRGGGEPRLAPRGAPGGEDRPRGRGVPFQQRAHGRLRGPRGGAHGLSHGADALPAGDALAGPHGREPDRVSPLLQGAAHRMVGIRAGPVCGGEQGVPEDPDVLHVARAPWERQDALPGAAAAL